MHDTHKQRTNTNVRHGVAMMFVPMRMNCSNEACAQDDQHEANSKFKTLGEPFRHWDSQTHNKESNNCQRDRVAQPPIQTHLACAAKLPFGSNESSHSDNVIRIERMPQSQKEAQPSTIRF